MAGLDPPAGRSPFGAAKARPSTPWSPEREDVDAPDEPSHRALASSSGMTTENAEMVYLLRSLQSRTGLLRCDPERIRPREQEGRVRPKRRAPDQERGDADGGDDDRDQADAVDDTGFEQKRSGRGHRQEEGEIDHDRMLSAEAQDVEPAHMRQQRSDRDDGAGAAQAEHQRDRRPLAQPQRHEATIDEGPRREPTKRQRRMRPR